MIPQPARLMAVCLVTLLAFLPAGAVASNVVVGNCNQINQNIEVGGQATLIIENDCFADDPAKSFRVRYFWVDSLSLSFLMAGYADENLQVIAGKSPRMWHGGVYPLLDEILERFGERPGPDSKLLHSAYSSNLLTREGSFPGDDYRGFHEIPEGVRRNLRIYNGGHPIIWPDLDAFAEFYESSRWPSNYHMSYGTGSGIDYGEISRISGGGPRADKTVIKCTMIHELVTRREFDQYPSNVSRMADLVEAERFPSPLDPNFAYGNKLGSDASFASFGAMKYFSAQNWPKDFLVRHGGYLVDECGSSAGLSISVLPRELFALVAVVEATGRRLELGGFDYQVDRSAGLREDFSTTEDAREEFAFPAMNRGDTVIVPLRIELRYDLNHPRLKYTLPNDVSLEYYDAVRSLDRPVVLNDGTYLPGKAVRKDPSSFRPPSFNELTRTYYFGDVHDLKHVIIGGDAYEVRKTPRMARLSVAGFLEGSCPFLEFVEADGKPSLHGRVLVGASSKDKSATEIVPVPPKARSIILSEREPEISYLKTIALIDEDNDKRIVLAENVVLKPWDKIELTIPEALRDRSLLLDITGHYELLAPNLLSASTEPEFQ